MTSIPTYPTGRQFTEATVVMPTADLSELLKRLDRIERLLTDHNGKQPEPIAVDRQGAARYLHRSVSTIDGLRRSGELPSIRVRGSRMFRVVDLQNYINNQLGEADR